MSDDEEDDGEEPGAYDRGEVLRARPLRAGRKPVSAQTDARIRNARGRLCALEDCENPAVASVECPPRGGVRWFPRCLSCLEIEADAGDEDAQEVLSAVLSADARDGHLSTCREGRCAWNCEVRS